MLEPVGPYKISAFGHLLDYQEGRVRVRIIMALILLIQQSQQQAFRFFQSNIFLFLYYSLKFLKGVYCHYIPSASENFCQNIQTMYMTAFRTEICLDEQYIQILELRESLNVDSQVYLIHFRTYEKYTR